MSGGVLVLLGAEPAQSLVVGEDPERVTAGNEHVDPQVELVVVNEKRLGDVLLADVPLRRLHLLDVLSDEDAFTLTASLWLEDEVSSHSTLSSTGQVISCSAFSDRCSLTCSLSSLSGSRAAAPTRWGGTSCEG